MTQINEPQTMLYRTGTEIKCGPYSLDFITVNDSEIKEKLAKGWHKTPEEADKASQKEREDAKQAALEAQALAQQKLLDDANNSGNGSARNPKTRKPKRTEKDENGDLGADMTNPNGENPDADPDEEAPKE